MKQSNQSQFKLKINLPRFNYKKHTFVQNQNLKRTIDTQHTFKTNITDAVTRVFFVNLGHIENVNFFLILYLYLLSGKDAHQTNLYFHKSLLIV